MDKGAESKLVGAYIAGNTESQLTQDVKENRPCEGIVLMILAYEDMKNSDRVVKIEGMDYWIGLRDKGELKSVCDR